MILTCTYNVRSDGRPGFGSDEKIVATYSQHTRTTNLLVDADIVTIGLTARLLQQQYDDFLKNKPDIKARVDKVITEELNHG